MVTIYGLIYDIVRNSGSQTTQAAKWYSREHLLYYDMLANKYLRDKTDYDLIQGLYDVAQEAAKFKSNLDCMMSYLIGNQHSNQLKEIVNNNEYLVQLYNRIHKTHQADVIAFVLDQVKLMRSGQTVDITKIINAFKTYRTVLTRTESHPRSREISGSDINTPQTINDSLFISTFGQPLLQQSSEFWCDMGHSLALTQTVPEYVTKAFESVENEQHLLGHKREVFGDLEVKMLQCCTEGLVESHTGYLFETGAGCLAEALGSVLKDDTAHETVRKLIRLAAKADSVAVDAWVGAHAGADPMPVDPRTPCTNGVEAKCVAAFQHALETLGQKQQTKFITGQEKPDQNRAVGEFCKTLLMTVLPRYMAIIEGGLNDQPFREVIGRYTQSDPHGLFKDDSSPPVFTLPMHIATFCDRFITRKRDQTGDEVTSVAKAAVYTLMSITDCDRFMNEYRKRLSERLLKDPRRIPEPESEFIAQLKVHSQHFEASEILKMQTMLRDINKHATQDQGAADSTHGFVFAPLQIHEASWDLQHSPNFPFPAQIQASIDDLAASMKNKVVHVLPDKGHVTINFTPPGGRTYAVTMSPIQYAVLDHVSGATGTVTVADVLGRLSMIPPEVIAAHMHEMYTAKVIKDTQRNKKTKLSTLLKCSTPNLTADEIIATGDGEPGRCLDAALTVNVRFKSAVAKVTIGVQPVKMTKRRERAVIEDVGIQREMKIDSAVVRIMKGRKRMHHDDLLMAVSDELRHWFSAQPQDTKARIENLIENEYLTRDADDRDVYHYKA